MKDGGHMDIDHWAEFDMGDLVAMASALAARGRVFAWYCALLASWRVLLDYMNLCVSIIAVRKATRQHTKKDCPRHLCMSKSVMSVSSKSRQCPCHLS
jgi:hypothetical protein